MYWWGGINRMVLPKACAYVVMALSIYIFQTKIDVEFYTNSESFHDTVHAILSFLVFLLVFRLNQCMARHYAAYALITDLFYGLERLMLDFCMHLQGEQGATNCLNSISTDSPSVRTCINKCMAAKINVIRLVLAFAVSTVMHFQLLDAASDSAGLVDEVACKQVIFLYCRLRTLLHPEEMEIIDESISLMRDNSSQVDQVFRVEVTRYRASCDPSCQPVIGLTEEDREPGGVTISPAPKLVMTMLTQALLRPGDEPWGYQARMYAIFARVTLKLANDSMHLESIIMSPTPLPYLQHCRVLFFVFAIVFPMSMDTTKGIVDNVVLPLLIFWAIMGFEVLSGVLENPLGTDDTDMNLFEKIHSLEVGAEKIFNATERSKASLEQALARTEALVMGERPSGRTDAAACQQADPSRCFRFHFRWTPLPTVILSDLMDAHGDVQHMHELWLTFRTWLPSFSLRKMLRQSLYRRKGGCVYKQVGDQDQSTDAQQMPVDFNKDPTYFCHFVEYLGSMDLCEAVPDESVGDGCSVPQPSQNRWKQRALDLVADHPAEQLLKKCSDEDTERSLLVQSQRSGRRLMSFLDGWESLS
jgi:predicted membrane chloride channel (bestrophin family)